MSENVIITNGNIITMNHAQPRANTMVIEKGIIKSIGNDIDYSSFLSKEENNFKIINLEGKTVIPGFIESHNHFNLVSTMYTWIDISYHRNFPTIASVLQKISEIVSSFDKEDSNEEGKPKQQQWVKLFGFDDTLIEECRGITREEIDSVSNGFPVYIWHPSLHRAYVNSKAFELAGIKDDVINPPGGFYTKKDGKLTGQADEMPAYKPLNDLILDSSSPQVKRFQMWETAKKFARSGITSVQDLFCGPLLFQAYLNAFVEHDEEKNAFPVRVTCYCPANVPTPPPHSIKHNPKFLRFAGKKMFADGSIQCHTACCSQPYNDAPDEKGALSLPLPVIEKTILEFHKNGFQVAIHANGDEAIDRVIGAFEKAQQQFPRFNHRHRIEHCQMVTDSQLLRLSKLGMCVSFFVSHVFYWGDRHRSMFLGEDRATHISPLRTAIRHNVAFGLHSDCPVTPADPLHAIWVAVNRKTMSGYTLGEEERISVEQALRTFTIDAAYLAFEEEYKGSLEVGKVGDFLVLSQNIMEIETEEIIKVKVLSTYLGGANTFTAEIL